MNYLFLDVYKKTHARVSKDTAGGYGTENDLGDGIVGKLLSRVIKKSVFWPNLSFTQLMAEFVAKGDSCVYKKQIGTSINGIGEWDAIFICSSIVCFETELEVVKKLCHQKKSTAVFLCGSVAEHLIHKIPNGVTVLAGNYDFLLQALDKEHKGLQDLTDRKLIKVPNGLPDKLSAIPWGRYGIPENKNRFLAGGKAFYPFLSTRGCPYSCFEYCTYPTSQGRRVLHDPVDSVMEKLAKIAEESPNAHIVFRDPVFSINLRQTKQLLKKIGDAQLPLEFSAELHLKNVDDQFIEACNYANITWLKFGIESAFESIRKSSNRYSVSNDKQMDTILKLRKANIKTVGMFILAQPEDTIDTCNQTIDYACSLKLDIAQFSIFTPYPGTPYFDKNIEKTNFKNYQDINQFRLIFDHPKISPRDARRLLEKSYIKFLTSKVTRYFH